MEPREIAPGVHWVGVSHPDLKRFDDLLPTDRGTCYNAYLAQADKTAVIGTVKALLKEKFLNNIRSLIDPSTIDYVVLNHTEPDHSGALGELLAAAPQATVVATRPGLLYLRDMFNTSCESHAVDDGDELDLDGKALRFFLAPFLHWPDTMFTYLSTDRLLFSGDAFGAHYCGASVFDDECEDFEEDFQNYYEIIMRPFRDHVLEAVEKIEELDIDIVCPSHGPLLRRDGRRKIMQYKEWATVPMSQKPTVAIFYVSAHGNTKKLVDAVAAGVEEAGGEVEVLHSTDASWLEQRRAMERACGLMFASPTFYRDVPKPMWETLAYLPTVKLSVRCAAVFGSFGWSGEARKMIVQRLESLRIPVCDEAPSVKFTPTDEDLSRFREFGKLFVQRICESR